MCIYEVVQLDNVPTAKSYLFWPTPPHHDHLHVSDCFNVALTSRECSAVWRSSWRTSSKIHPRLADIRCLSVVAFDPFGCRSQATLRATAGGFAELRRDVKAGFRNSQDNPCAVRDRQWQGIRKW